MPRIFEKKQENNEKSVSLLIKPRFDFIDYEYKKMKPLITQVIEMVEGLKESYAEPLEEIIAKLTKNYKNFQLLLEKLLGYKIHVLKSVDPYDQLGSLLVSSEIWLDALRKNIATGFINLPSGDLSPKDYLLNITIKNFENLELILKDAIVTRKEAIILEYHDQLKVKKNSCTIL